MDHRARERRTVAVAGGLTDNDLIRIKEKGSIAQNQLDLLNPYFDLLIENIHEKWEGLDLSDGEGAKLLKFQLIAVKKLREAMGIAVTHGKQAAKKLEVNNG